MWDNATEASKENTGISYPSISVGAILSDTALVYPAISRFRTGGSLTQVTTGPSMIVTDTGITVTHSDGSTQNFVLAA
jgi:hypothetical protein